MAESRDANDPRDQLRGMNKEARAEFEGEEAHDTGGQERATRAERGGEGGRVPTSAARGATSRQREGDALQVPRGDAAEGGGSPRAAPGGPAEPKKEGER